MNEKSDGRFNREFDRLERQFPRARAALDWLRRPGVRLVRLPLAALLFVGGVFSFLPMLGLWMLPLALLLAAVDIPLLRGPVAGAITRVRAWWRQRRNNRKKR